MLVYIGLLVLILVSVWILIWISMKKQRRPIKPIYVPMQPYLHSPQYRYPTKCFDCVHQESYKHWNRNYGYGLASY
jgi:hypothetical protein